MTNFNLHVRYWDLAPGCLDLEFMRTDKYIIQNEQMMWSIQIQIKIEGALFVYFFPRYEPHGLIHVWSWNIWGWSSLYKQRSCSLTWNSVDSFITSNCLVRFVVFSMGLVYLRIFSDREQLHFELISNLLHYATLASGLIPNRGTDMNIWSITETNIDSGDALMMVQMIALLL